MSVKLKISAPLDPAFQPAVIFNRNYLAKIRPTNKAVPLTIGLEGEAGRLSRHETFVNPEADADTLRYVEGIVKFLIWAYGGWKIYFGGPKNLGEHIRKLYSPTGARAFDIELMTR